MKKTISRFSESDFRKKIREELQKAGLNGKSNSSEQEELLTREDVAWMMQKSVQAVDNYRRRGTLRSHQFEGNIFFFRSEVIEDILMYKERRRDHE